MPANKVLASMSIHIYALTWYTKILGKREIESKGERAGR